MSAKRSLRTRLLIVFAQVLAVAAAVAAVLIAGWQLPQVRAANEREQTRIVWLTLGQIEGTLDDAEALLQALAEVAAHDDVDVQALESLLRPLAGGSLFENLYLVDDRLRIVALGLSGAHRTQSEEWRGNDLSGLPVLQQARHSRAAAWSAKYLSPLDAQPVVALALPAGSRTLMAELAVARLAGTALRANRIDGLLVVVTDSHGEVVAAPQMDAARQRVNLRSLPLVAAALDGRQLFARFAYAAGDYQGTAMRAERLGWVVVAAHPLAVANATRRAVIIVTSTILVLAAVFGGLTLSRLSAGVKVQLDRSIAYAGAVAEGHYQAPAGAASNLSELARLDKDLARMARRIQDRETLLRAVIDTTPLLAIQLYTREGRVVDWNPASAAIFGYTREQALGKRLDELVYDSAQQQEFVAMLAAIEHSGQAAGPWETEIRDAAGARRWLLSTTFAVPGPDGEAWFACMDIDISERRREQLALQASERKFTTFFEANPVALAVVRRNGAHFDFLDVNSAWERLLGHTRERALNRHRAGELAFTIFADAAQRQSLIEMLDAGGALTTLDMQLLCADGSKRSALLTPAVIPVADESLLVYALQDVSDKRALEEDLRRLNAELEQRIAQRTDKLSEANAQLQRTLDALRATQDRLIQSEKLASLGQLVAGVAHELGTPIGNALMAASTLQERQHALRDRLATGLRRSELEAFIAQVAEGSEIGARNLQRAATLLQGFKQIAVDQTSGQRRRFDLGELIGEVVLTMQPTLRAAGVTLAHEGGDGVELDSYPGALAQVLTNLVHNAAVHAFEGRHGGRVHIAAAAGSDGQIVVELADDGRGIAREHLSRVFEPFFTTRLGSGGSGLGMVIVHNLVTGPLGGTVAVDSQPGAGTVVRLRLPRVAASAPVAAPG